MDAPSTSSLRVKKITPRLVEIMNRMVLGQPMREIREEFGISQVRFSLIVNSPLFKLELKRKLLKREEVIFDIQENVLEGAKVGTKFYREILGGQPGEYSSDLKLKAANAVSSLAVKLMGVGNGVGGGNGGGNGGEGESYEERLRKVTIEESVKTVTHKEEVEDESNINAILGEIEFQDELEEPDLLFPPEKEEEEGDFEPPQKIEEIIPTTKESDLNVETV